SSVVGNATISNSSSLDMFVDLSVRLLIASNTIAAGANLAVWLYPLLDDGSTYGDGQFTVGTQAAKTPVLPVFATIPLVAAASQTNLIGAAVNLQVPPGDFKFALQNNSGFALTAGTQTFKYRSYNINLND